MLRCIGYVSSADKSITSQDITDILDVSVKNNDTFDITGILCYHDGNFLQFIEGESDNVHNLIEKIKEDKRNSGMIVVHDELIAGRMFPDWRMALRRLSDIPKALRGNCRDIMRLSLEQFEASPDHADEIHALIHAFKESFRL